MNARRLNEQVYTDILIKGESFTKENADDFKEGTELLGKLLTIHREFHEKNPFRDMFSEYLMEYGRLNVRAGQFFTPYNVCDMMAKMQLGIEDDLKGEPLRILDPAAGTGRFMLSTASHYAKEVGMYNFLFTNIDIDKRMFTFCVMNAILYGIPAIHIHGDTLRIKFWDCFATIPSMGLCQWKRIDAKLMEDRFKEMLEASIPKRGLEIFMDERVKTRVREKRWSTIVKPTQRTLFEG